MQQNENSLGVLRSAIFRILKSVAVIGLRYGVSAGTAQELVRRAWVEAAADAIQDEGKKPMLSRICALTGLYRKEVVRLQSLPPVSDDEKEDHYSRTARITTAWLRDERFLTAKRTPAVLKMEGVGSFQELIKLYSGDMSPRAMLDELVRTKAVTLEQGNKVKLCDRGFIAPESGVEALQILGDDTTDLINTIAYNLDTVSGQRRFQRKVTYRHIPEKHVKPFQEYSARHGQALLEKLDRWLARRDTETIEHNTPGSRLGLGIYLIEEQSKLTPHPQDTTGDTQ